MNLFWRDFASSDVAPSSVASCSEGPTFCKEPYKLVVGSIIVETNAFSISLKISLFMRVVAANERKFF